MATEADVLLGRGVIDSAQLSLALRRSELQHIPLHQAVVDLGLASEQAAWRAAAEASSLDFIDIEDLQVPPSVLDHVPVRVALSHRLAPLSLADGLLTAAFVEAPSTADLGKLRLVLGARLRAMLCAPSAHREFVKRHYGLGAETIQRLRAEGATADNDAEIVFDVKGTDTESPFDAPIARFVDQILSEALRLDATDIHLEPFGNVIRLRYRIDGLLQDVPVPPGVRQHYLALVSRLKVMAGLDIAERRIAHDGRIAMKRGGAQYDLRVSIIPTAYGESVCLRILGRDQVLLDLSQLGMAGDQRLLLEEFTRLPQGLALLTGPTGSGKTTTLYAALAHARDGRRKIITIEDPVEYKLDGISQIQTRDDLGLDFGAGLRSVLRHDPDVILIGEIRDKETADIAMRSAQTGHLVFSTLHTNDSLSAIPRLLEMGVEPFVVGSALVCSIAQRLARRVCPRCAVPDDAISPEVRAEMAAALDVDPGAVHAMRGTGCAECHHTGERGRVAMYEFFVMSDDIVDLLNTRPPAGRLREIAHRQGWRSLRELGWQKVQAGVVAVAEHQRITRRLALPAGMTPHGTGATG